MWTLPSLSSHNNTLVPWVQSEVFIAWTQDHWQLHLLPVLHFRHPPHLQFSPCLQLCLYLQLRLCLQFRLHLHLHLRLRPQLRVHTPQMSNSECSSLEEQMPGKLRYCRESAIQQRVQSSTGLIHRVFATRYVLIIHSFSMTLSIPSLYIQVKLNPTIEVRSAYSFTDS